MKHHTRIMHLVILVAMLISLVGCSRDVHVSVDVTDGEPEGTAEPTTVAELVTETTEATTETPQDANPTSDAAEPTQASAQSTQPPTEPAQPTQPPAEPTQAPAQPTQAPAEPTQAPAEPTQAPAEPTPDNNDAPQQPQVPELPDCGSYDGQTYTLVLTEQQVNALITTALQTAGQVYVQSASVGLQDGQITVKAKVKPTVGPAVDALVVVRVSVQNYDLYVEIVQAQVGQMTLNDNRKAAINTALKTALEAEMAQAHDYSCVQSVTIQNGSMTIVYH